jgi:hypothetical protein
VTFFHRPQTPPAPPEPVPTITFRHDLTEEEVAELKETLAARVWEETGGRPQLLPDPERRWVVVLTSQHTGRQSLTSTDLHTHGEAQREATQWQDAGHHAEIKELQ